MNDDYETLRVDDKGDGLLLLTLNRPGVANAMNTRMGRIWDGYADDELDLIADFLTRTVAAGRASADEIG